MKRFFVFSGRTYYPGGGWHDFVGHFYTLEEAQAAGRKACIPTPDNTYPNDWYHIFDSHSGQIVALGIP